MTNINGAVGGCPTGMSGRYSGLSGNFLPGRVIFCPINSLSFQ